MRNPGGEFRGRKVNVSFFEVVPLRPDNVPFSEIVKAIASQPLQDREVQVEDEWVRVEELNDYRDCIEITMVRNQLRGLPHVGESGVPVEPLNIPEKKGLSHFTSLLYHPPTRAMAVLRTRESIALGGLILYFTKASPTGPERSTFRFDPIFRKHAADRIDRLQTVRRLEVKFARMTPTFWSETLKSFEEYRAAADRSLAMVVDLKLSVGRKGGSLRLSDIKEKVRALLGSRDEGGIDVEKLIVVGRDHVYDADEVINLLDAHLRAEVELAPDPGRVLRAVTHQQAVRSAWNSYEDLVTKTIGTKP